ncbi:MAG: RecQ family ATP-dependent DNA helicase [Bacteroidetes bacterium]|nr:MAG: RecQ family ATP-dependent DNA helicase [Bacteroidota bacterium]
MEIHNILVKYWGYSSFRPMQEDIIQSVLDGRDTLALLPTGGGKSICFQVPALAMEGICVVISPLIALMKDQVENLKDRGIKAAAVHSGMHPREIDIAINNSVFGDLKFLYVSPERLKSPSFRQNLSSMNVCLLAVDEAHCISQWGYDFRPPYLNIAEIRPLINDAPVLALTATATNEVIVDIQEKLEFKEKNVLRKSFERKNLSYVVFHEEDKGGRLLKIVGNVKGSGIVYVRNRRKCREVSDFLNNNGIKATFYHAGLEARTREYRQDEWMKDKKQVIVATNAFGMGIDKPSVRFVVHFDLPDSTEAYFQEAGRAGRDGKRAYAVQLYEEADIRNAKQNLAISFPEAEVIRSIYNAIGNYYQIPLGGGKDLQFDFDLQDFSTRYRMNTANVFSALKILEKEGYILLGSELENPSKIMFSIEHNELYTFQVENPGYDPFIKLLLRSYGGIFTEFVRINEKELAKRADTTDEKIRSALTKMQKMGLLIYIPATSSPQLLMVNDRIDSKAMNLSGENYSKRKKAAMKRMQSVLDYIQSSNHCRSQMLLKYFGETGAQRCGLCDVCLDRNKINVSEMEFNEILEKIKPSLKKKPQALNELLFIAKEFPEDKVINVVMWLVDNEKVDADEKQLYSWRKQFKMF